MLTSSDRFALSNHSEGSSVSHQLHSREKLAVKDLWWQLAQHPFWDYTRQMPKSPMSSGKHSGNQSFTDRKVTEFSELFLSIASLLSHLRELCHMATLEWLCVYLQGIAPKSRQKLVRHWKRLPREAVDAPPFKVFKTILDGALSYLV